VLPQLIVIGTMKGGTRSLYEYLRAHPQVFMSTPKELNFFSYDEHWARGTEWYQRHFAGDEANSATVVGEASPSYSAAGEYPATVERMASVVPSARLVYIVRQPVDRIQSHYQHRARSGVRMAPIDDEVLTDPAYIDRSSYASQIERYLQRFPADQLLVVPSERLQRDRASTMAEIYQFIGVDDGLTPRDALTPEFSRSSERRVARPGTGRLRQHRATRRLVAALPKSVRARLSPLSSVPSTAGHLRLSDATRHVLAERLAPEVVRLRAHLPADFDGWGIA
jgi:hypothetical protein